MMSLVIDACRYRARCWAALIVALLALGWSAQAHATRGLRFVRMGVEEGLPQESVLSLLQDRAGFMWFGTQGGLVRYDGYHSRVFRNDPNDPASLVDNYVPASYEDDKGRLWFGTRGGLVRFDAAAQKFIRYPLMVDAHMHRNSAVTSIAGDGHGGLWIGSGDGLVHLDPDSGRFAILRHDALDATSLRDNRVTALARDAHGGLWIGTNVGIDHLPPGSTRINHFDIVGPAHHGAGVAGDARHNAVASLSMNAHGTLWIGTGAGLEAWRLGEEGQAPQRRHIGPEQGMEDVRIFALYHDHAGNLWVGTDLEGLKWLDPASGRFVGYNNDPLDRHSLSDNQVSSIWVDRTGTLWVGTMFGGLNRTDLASGGFERFSAPLGRGERSGIRKVRAIAAGAGGDLWLGTTGAGLLRVDRAGAVEQIRHDPRRPDSLPDDIVNTVLPARGRVWVGAPTGLSWLDPAGGRFTTVPLGDEAGATYVQSLSTDRAGNLWVATRGGLFERDAADGRVRGWRHDPADPDSLGENFCFGTVEDGAGMIWVGTENGLDRYDPATGKFVHFRHDPRDPASLRHNRIHNLVASARGELWIGTAAGLHRMERRRDGSVAFRLFPVRDGNEQPSIGAILEDGKGRLWVSTTNGLSRLDPVSGRYKTFTAKDGLSDGSFFVGSAATGADGELHFGGVSGMTSFQPDAIRENPYPPTAIITDFSVLNQPKPVDPRSGRAGAVELPWRDSVFTLEFAALHYADPRANHFAYRLRGFDRDWTGTDASKPFATYTNLDPGSYLFEVRAANKDGVWSERPATMAITIAPPFWMTWWCRLAAGLAVLGAGVGIYRLRVRVLVQQTARLERQVGTRTAELTLQMELAEARERDADIQRQEVEEARRNIALLSDIGRELTANLDGDAIMDNVYLQVRQLMDVDVFAIGLARPGGGLDFPYVRRQGRAVDIEENCPVRVLRLGEHCVATGEDTLIDDLDLAYPRHREASAPAQVPGEPRVRSLMLVPIPVGARVLGVLEVKSERVGAFDHVQLDMLGTLAAYVGVALDNADAYRRLKETQAQLAASEKLASLGSLVAGVAHELNTPIGNSLLMASTLHEKTEDLAARLAGNQLKRSDLEAWIAADREATSLIMRSLHAAADLVNSFKQVSVDQASAQRRRFDLARACREIAATMMNQVRRSGHTLELQVAPDVPMDSYPGPLGQVLINFVNNALLHAFEGRGGHMVLTAAPIDADTVRIEFADDGHGIAPEHLARVFDPFFTTRMGRGGSGLGLNIAYNIVTTLLQGTIRVESTPGQGTVFVIDLPRHPAAAAIAVDESPVPD